MCILIFGWGEALGVEGNGLGERGQASGIGEPRGAEEAGDISGVMELWSYGVMKLTFQKSHVFILQKITSEAIQKVFLIVVIQFGKHFSSNVISGVDYLP